MQLTISQLIARLQDLEKRSSPNAKVHFTVRDSYSIHGEQAILNLKTPASDTGDYSGYYINDDNVNLHLNLTTGFDNKKPKITFRK